MKAKTILKGFGIGIGTLFLLGIIVIGVLLELHNFRASVCGQVTDNQGNPVPNAKIEFMMLNTDSIEYDCKTTTNSDGSYFIALPSIRVALDTSPSYLRHVSITANGYVPISKNLSLKKGNNPKTDFGLLKALTIRGRAVDTKGKPLANKTLLFYTSGKLDDTDFGISSSSSKTDEKGYFDLSNVGPYHYAVTLYANENKKRYQQKLCNCEFVNLANIDNTKDFEITFNNPYDYCVEGVIIDSSGNSIPNTYISTYDRYGYHWSAYSDSNGKFCIIGLDGLGKEEFELYVRSVKKQVNLNSKDIKFIMPRM